LPLPLNQNGKNFCGNALQLENATGAAQSIGVEIKLEVLAKSDRARDSEWLR